MHRKHGKLILVLSEKCFKFRQFLHTGRTVSRPEVDDHDLSSFVRKPEFTTVKGRCRKVCELLTDFITDGSIAFKADRFCSILRIRAVFFLCICSVIFLRSKCSGGCRRCRSRFDRRTLFYARIEEIKPRQGKAKKRNRNAPQHFGKMLPACLGTLFVVSASTCR